MNTCLFQFTQEMKHCSRIRGKLQHPLENYLSGLEAKLLSHIIRATLQISNQNLLALHLGLDQLSNSSHQCIVSPQDL